MRISNEELRRIAEQDYAGVAVKERIYADRISPEGESVVSALESPDMKKLSNAIAEVPDIREQIVASLKERIESGTYQVGGEHIAEMMLRRALADRMH
jgi:negative regulator of flagellin synthesis FlgM